MIPIKVRCLDADAHMPQFSYSTDACADLRSNITCKIESMETRIIPTGISLEIPQGYEGQIRARSGLAAKHEIMVLNGPGTIDAGYRGEVKVILKNLGSQSFHVKKGDRIAQLGIRQVPDVTFVKSDQLSASQRDKGGFGSTGDN